MRLELFREADARVYGAGEKRTGFKMKMGDRLTISPSRSKTRLISMGRGT